MEFEYCMRKDRSDLSTGNYEKQRPEIRAGVLESRDPKKAVKQIGLLDKDSWRKQDVEEGIEIKISWTFAQIW